MHRLLFLICSLFWLNALGAGPAKARAPLSGLDDVRSFTIVIEELKAEVEKTPRAAYEIARIYEFCGVFWGPKTKADWFKLYSQSVHPKDPKRAMRMALAERRYVQCEALLRAGDVYDERIKWLETGNKKGDLAAQIAHRVEKGQRRTDDFVDVLKRALDSGDAIAIWEVSRALFQIGVEWKDLSGQAWPGEKKDGLRAVLQSAACQMGYPCAPNSALMQSFCIRGTCDLQSYDAWLPSFFDAKQTPLVRAEVPRMLQALRNRRASALLF
jgi:hypothetical protein